MLAGSRPGGSAQATTAAQSRFRVAAPNSQPRTVTVVAMDDPAARLLGTGFRHASDPDLLGDIAVADLVVLVATAGQDVPAARTVCRMCRASAVSATGLVVGDTHAGLRTLAQLRPYTPVLVATASPGYVDDLLAVLRSRP